MVVCLFAFFVLLSFVILRIEVNFDCVSDFLREFLLLEKSCQFILSNLSKPSVPEQLCRRGSLSWVLRKTLVKKVAKLR